MTAINCYLLYVTGCICTKFVHKIQLAVSEIKTFLTKYVVLLSCSYLQEIKYGVYQPAVCMH